MASYDDTATVSGSIVRVNDGADRVPLKNWRVTLPASLDGYSEIGCTKSGKNLLDTAISETKSHNSVSITCDGNGKYTATGTATGGSGNITFTLKTPCTIQSGMYLHLMNSGANANVSITLQKQDNTTIYAPALSPANRIADLSSYVGQTIYSIRFYIVNGSSFEMSLTPMLCFSNTATSFEPYTAPTTATASLGRTIYGGTADVVNGTGTDENGNAFTFTPLSPTPETPLGVSNWWADEGESEITYYKDGYGFTSVTIHKETPDGEPVEQTAKLHKIVYGGLVDVVKGKAEPKNWIDDNLSNLEPGTINGNTGADESANNRVRNINAIPFPYDEIASSYRWTFPSGYKAAIRPFDANGNYVSLPSWAVGFVASLPQDLIGQGIVAMKFVLAKNDNSAITPNDMKNVGYLLEKGSTATSYAPFFSPFSFPPISMETDEGENTLYADEGDSAITYRKAVD